MRKVFFQKDVESNILTLRSKSSVFENCADAAIEVHLKIDESFLMT